MPQRQPKAAIAAREAKLLRYYAEAWKRVTDLQDLLASDPKQWRKVARLRAAQRSIERILDQLDAYALAWFSHEFPAIYAMGVNAAAKELGVAAAEVWAAIDTEAVSKMAAEGFSDLLKATRLTRRTTKALIRTVIEDEVMRKLIDGDTAEAAARRARKVIEKKGIYSVRYSNGSKHGLREYANMAVRTKTATAYNLGTVEAGQGQGVKFWEVFDGICGWTFHDDSAANGKIVTADEALAYPISHPNCRRAFGGRPDLSPMPGVLPPKPEVRVPTAEAREKARQRTADRVARRARRG